jgi:hypothetical protein
MLAIGSLFTPEGMSSHINPTPHTASMEAMTLKASCVDTRSFEGANAPSNSVFVSMDQVTK